MADTEAQVGGRREFRHEPDDNPLWNESWYFDFAADDGSLGGYVRLGLVPGQNVAWFWAYLVGEDRPLVAVRDHDVPLPRGKTLEIRTSGLWSALHCETPDEHWSIGLEAFGVALDDPAEAYRQERGERVALGLDLEWEGDAPVFPYPGISRYEQACRVHGEVLVGDDRIAFEGSGERDHSWGRRDWWAFPWTWTSGRLEDDTAFHAVRVGAGEQAYQTGFVTKAGSLEPLTSVEVATTKGDDGLPTAATFRLDELELAVEPLRHAPVLVIAPDGRRSRFPRTLCRYTDRAGGRSGWGWTEWLQPPAVS